MNKNFLATLNNNLEISSNDIVVRNLNLNRIERSIDSLFSNIEIDVEVIIAEGEVKDIEIKPDISIVGDDSSEDDSSEDDSSEDDSSEDDSSEDDSSEDEGLPGSSSGEGASNITGGEVSGNPSVTGEVAKATITNLEQSLKTNYVSNNEAIEKAIEDASGSTVTYNKETNRTTIYMWYEGHDKIILWGTGIQNYEPYIYCIAMSTDGNTKTMKAYTTKKLLDTEIRSRNRWRANRRIKDENETVTSPVTGETYYIIAEDSTVVGSAAWNTQWWQMAIAHNATELSWDWEYEFGLSLSSTPSDIFDASQITYEDIAVATGLTVEEQNEIRNEYIEEIETIVGNTIEENISNGILEDRYEVDKDSISSAIDFSSEEDTTQIQEELNNRIQEIQEELNNKLQEELGKINVEEIKNEVISSVEEEFKINGNYSKEELKNKIEEINSNIEEIIKEKISKIKKELLSEKEELLKDIASRLAKEHFRNKFKTNLLKQYITDNSLVMFLNNDDGDALSNTLSEILDKINSGKSEEYIEECKEKQQKVLDSIGKEDNEEIKDDAILELAKELVDCIENKKDSNNAAIAQILDNIDSNENGGSDDHNGNGIGLRYDIYNKIKSISDNGLDINCVLYATGVAEVVAKYFTSGVMYVAVHTGGIAIVGVGTSLLISAIQNVASGMSIIQSGANSSDMVNQAKKLADGISTMFVNGTISTMVVGTMTSSNGPIPLIATGSKQQIQHSSVKTLIMIAALAAYIMLAAGGVAAMSAKTQKPWNSMLSALGAKDGNDLFALLVAAGIKASIVTTIAQTIETTAGSTGTGMLIPFGP